MNIRSKATYPFPTTRSLNMMTADERQFALEHRIDELHRERYGLECGDIKPWKGTTKVQLLRSCRRRLRRAERAAGELGIELYRGRVAA
jgi:hypothetical protein